MSVADVETVNDSLVVVCLLLEMANRCVDCDVEIKMTNSKTKKKNPKLNYLHANQLLLHHFPRGAAIRNTSAPSKLTFASTINKLTKMHT